MERDKALDMALGQIEKQFGKGAVMRMGEEAKVKIASIPTGALSLDIALGIGGLPRGRVIEIYGPESSGKCLTADTYLWTDVGLETVAELFARCGQAASCTSRVTDVRHLGVRAVNERGELEQVAALTHNNRRPVRRIRLRSGRCVTVTHNHPLRVVNEAGHLVWRQAGRIAQGDVVVSAELGAVEAAAGDGLSEDEAVLLGYLVAEGSLSSRSAVRFTNWDPEVASEFTRLMEGLFGVGVRNYADRDYAVHSTAVRARLADEYGLDYVTAAGKRVPHRVRTGGHKAQRAFLSALFDGDGWIDTSSTVGLGTASEQLAREVQLLLYGLGIPATVSSCFNRVYQRDYWTVTVNPAMAHRFLAEVGFRSVRRQGQVTANFRPSDRDLREVVAMPYTYEQVVAVEDAGVQPTFDLVLPRTHSFIANGVLSHNTTVALHAVAEAQKAGGIAAFIDAEHALDPGYAAALGVDVDALLVSQPDTGEQALEITDMLVRSGAIDIVVVDSVAALTPRAEIEGEMGDTHVGLQARLMSQALRKLAGTLSRSRTSAVFINQLREKIGVMFGCMSYDTRVTLADGTQEKIGKIVNQRLPVEVLSYDPERDEIVPRKVVDWFDNGTTDRFLQFTVARGGGNGRAQFACTPNHLVSTPGGWRPAGELVVGDRVLQSVPHRLSPFQWDVLLGGLLGDGALSPSRSGHAARFRFGHGARQVAYADWKASLFANIGTSRSTGPGGAVFHDLPPLPELAELPEAVYVGGKKVVSHDYLKRLTPLSLAVWYMDDASFTARATGAQERTRRGSGRVEICVEAMEAGSRQRLRDHLADAWGIDGRLRAAGTAGKAVLTFGAAASFRFQELIAPYVHPSMDSKLLPHHRGRFDVVPAFVEPRLRPAPMPVQAIAWKPPTRSMHRFDIQVEGNHNYFVDGVMVHNSPETTTGGRALKFYSSVRLDVRRIESLKDGTDVVGNRVRVKVVKNKCLAAGTRIFDPVEGRMHRIEDIVDRGEGTAVWAADKKGRLHVRPILARMSQGRQQVIALGFRDGTRLRVTPDHLVLTQTGWRQAGELGPGDHVARPRRVGGFGTVRPVPVDHARMLGYLIGDGYVGGKTPVAFTNTQADLQEDATRIAASLGCRVRVTHGGLTSNFSHRIPPAFFHHDVAEDVIANLLFGIFESDGWVAREQAGGLRVGFTTTSEQLAAQIHWLLLRWGIGSSLGVAQPGGRRSVIAGRRIVSKSACWQVRVSGIDLVRQFAAALPMWGPRGRALAKELDDRRLDTLHGSRRGYLAPAHTAPVLAHLRARGVTARVAADLMGPPTGDPRGGLKQVLGTSRLRRDGVTRLADALDDEFLHEILDEDVYYEPLSEIGPPEWAATYDVEVEEFHNLVAEDVVVHNCAPPFRQAEFDIMYGHGISKEGSILDIGVDEDIVKKAGAWYTYEGEQLGQGRENARKFLQEHDDVAAEISKRVVEKLGLVPTDVVGDEAEPPE